MNTQGEHPASGTVCSFWLTIWQNGLAPPAFTQTGTIHSCSFLGAAVGSAQKRFCVTVSCVFGSGFKGARRRLFPFVAAGVLLAGTLTHPDFTVTSGSPGCSTNVGM